MAMLTGPEIEEQMKLGRIVIDPKPKKFGSNSVDLALGNTLLVYKKASHLHEMRTKLLGVVQEFHALHDENGMPLGNFKSKIGSEIGWARRQMLDLQQAIGHTVDRMLSLDMAKEEPTVELKIPPEGLTVFPGILYLGHTEEWTETPHHVPCVEGRSSVGRLGLSVHVTAGFGDRNFRGDWTLELSVVQPVRVYAGVKICQIFYTETVGANQPYEGKYQNQRGPKSSQLWRELRPKE